ncbi:MAG: PilN domain-containing protein [Thermodesulfobacteriota bacterium]
MIRINLIPFRAARKKENVRQQVSIFLLLVVLLGIGLIWYNARLDKKIAALNSQIEYTQKEIVRFNKIAREVDALKEKLAVLKQQLAVIEALEENRGSAFQVLDSLNELVIPKRMWFTRMEAIHQEIRQADQENRGNKKRRGKQESEPEQEVTTPIPQIDIELEGVALDNKTVADFMTRLEESNVYTAVRLINLQQEILEQAVGDPIRLKRFQISCQKTPPESLLVGKAEDS